MTSFNPEYIQSGDGNLSEPVHVGRPGQQVIFSNTTPAESYTIKYPTLESVPDDFNGTVDIVTSTYRATVKGDGITKYTTGYSSLDINKPTATVLGNGLWLSDSLYISNGSVYYPSSSFNPSSIYSQGAKGLFIDASNISTIYQDSGFATTVSANGDPVGGIKDLSVNSNDLVQPTSISRPSFTIAQSRITFNGTNNKLSSGTTTFENDMDCFILMKETTIGPMVLAYSRDFVGLAFMGVKENGGAGLAAGVGSGSPTFAVDGIDVPGGTTTTRGQLYTAMPANAWHVVEIRNANMSSASWNSIEFGGYTSFLLTGDIAAIVLCPAQSLESRAKIRTYLGAKVGLAL